MTLGAVEELTDGLRAWKAKVGRGSAQGVLDAEVSGAAKKGVQLLVLDAGLVFGTDHIRAALYRAKRAMKEGRNASDSLAMETLLYASGERQLGSAIKKMAVDGQTEAMVVAQLTPGEFEPGEGWTVLPAKTSASPEALERFGITPLEALTVSRDQVMELVLEKVASVDILKK